MKITAVSTRTISIDSSAWYREAEPPVGERTVWDWPIIEITTDEGISGFTSGYGKQQETPAIASLINDIYAPRLLGRNPLERNRIWHDLKKKTRDLRSVTEALCGQIDVALWDIAGKAANLPIVDLLGRHRSSMPAYATASRFLTTPDQFAEEAQRVHSEGLHGYKLQIWEGFKADAPNLSAAREAVPDFPLMLDAVSGYNLEEAIRVGRLLDDLNYTWFEEPIPEGRYDQLRRLSDEIRTPVLGGESLDLQGLGSLIRLAACDIVRGDVHIKDGVTGLQMAFNAAQLAGVNLEVHATASPLLDIANLHVACANRNCEMVELFGRTVPQLDKGYTIFDFGVRNLPLKPDTNGFVHVPDGPGLGADLDWDWLDDHTTNHTELKAR